MEKRTLARPYAKAIFEIAAREKDFANWSELLHLLDFIIKHATVLSLLSNPGISVTDKSDFLIDIARQVHVIDGLSIQQKNFIKLLAANDRLLILFEITDLFDELWREHEKRVKIELTTAIKLDKKEEENVATWLKKYFNKTIELQSKIDSNIMGGFIARTNGLVIDGSMKGQLAKLKVEIGG